MKKTKKELKIESVNTPKPKKDNLVWLLVFVLTAAGVFSNYYFNELAWALRFVGWIILVCVLIGLIATTVRGKKIWAFAKDARIELLKVVWPKREETVKITMVIAALVVGASIVMWAMDSVLLWAVSWLTRQLI